MYLKKWDFKRLLQKLEIEDFKAKPPDCSCKNSPFKYGPSGHIVTGDLTIIENESRHFLSKGPKYRGPWSINWNYNFKVLMDAVKDYARKWIKLEQEDIDSLSEWLKAMRSLIFKQMKMLSRSMNAKAKSVLKDPDIAKTLSTIHEYVVVQADRVQNNIVYCLRNVLHPMLIIRDRRRK